jgi:hypothetical protein
MAMILPENYSIERYGLYVRFVNEEDSEFIVNLRTDSQRGQYISSTDASVEMQREWIRDYKKRERQGTDYYFMFESPKGIRLGVSRIYEIKKETFQTGSWVFKRDAPFGAAMLGDIICHEIAFELFPDGVNFHDIKKANTPVNKYADNFNPQFIFETKLTRYYINRRENYLKHKDAYLAKFLPLIERMNKKTHKKEEK